MNLLTSFNQTGQKQVHAKALCGFEEHLTKVANYSWWSKHQLCDVTNFQALIFRVLYSENSYNNKKTYQKPHQISTSLLDLN
jgi:hypothetical protein